MKRFAITTDFYIFAESEEEAVFKAMEHCEIQRKKNDDSCDIVEIYHQPQGTLNAYLVDVDAILAKEEIKKERFDEDDKIDRCGHF
jgi:hypothetical protein